MDHNEAVPNRGRARSRSQDRTTQDILVPDPMAHTKAELDNVDTSSTSSRDSSRSYTSREPDRLDHCPDPKGVLTIRMHSDRVPTGLDEHVKRRNDTIAWSAHVYDAKHERRVRSRSPLDVDVRYVDHKPLTFAKQRGRTGPKLEQQPRDWSAAICQETTSEKWYGPVIEILVHVRAGISGRFALPPGYEEQEWDTAGAFGSAGTSPASLERITIPKLPRPRYGASSMRVSKWQSAEEADTLPVRIEDLPIDQWSRKSLIIRSPYLRDAICACVGLAVEQIPQTDSLFYPASWKSLLGFEEPYMFLLQNFAKLDDPNADAQGAATPRGQKEQGRGSTLTTLQKEHLDVLVKYLRPFHLELVGPCLRRLSLPAPQVEFNLLWYVLQPFTQVYIRDEHGAIQVCVVAALDAPDARLHPIKRSRRQRSPLWEVELYFLITDGAKIGWRRDIRDIYSFPGTKDVTALDIVPVDIWDATDNGQRREQIMRRGRLMEKILRGGFQMLDHVPPKDSSKYKFSGKVVVDHRRGRNAISSDVIFFDGQPALEAHYPDWGKIYVNNYQKADDSYSIAIDPIPRSRTHRVYEEEYAPPPPRPPVYVPPATTRPRRRYRDDSTDRYGTMSHDQSISPALSDDQLMLLQPRLMAFGLKTKHWMSVDVGHLEEVQPSTESIENLIIEPRELEMIRALSRDKNDSTDSWAADFVEGKGSGKIILLHGPPGVGKTYTVESIAQWLDCPLLALTVADIGTVETRIEGELLKWFSLAEAWNAVLLVDEADIFLERRQNRDLARNGLVSAFLRRMEYFGGLLFLTTNRVGQIDDAFVSRVHVAIEYKHLSPLYTRKIWEGFFRKLARDRAGKIQIASNAKKWVLEKFEKEPSALNGRDIRNALQTAITLAQFEHSEDPDFDPKTMVVVVDKNHFERVLEMSNNFRDYITSIRREDERQRASGRLDRNDFRQGSPQAMSAALAQQYLMPGARGSTK